MGISTGAGLGTRAAITTGPNWAQGKMDAPEAACGYLGEFATVLGKIRFDIRQANQRLAALRDRLIGPVPTAVEGARDGNVCEVEPPAISNLNRWAEKIADEVAGLHALIEELERL